MSSIGLRYTADSLCRHTRSACTCSKSLDSFCRTERLTEPMPAMNLPLVLNALLTACADVQGVLGLKSKSIDSFLQDRKTNRLCVAADRRLRKANLRPAAAPDAAAGVLDAWGGQSRTKRPTDPVPTCIKQQPLFSEAASGFCLMTFAVMITHHGYIRLTSTC